MEMNCAKGDSVVLTDNCSQTFTGVVKSINLDLGRIVLSNIYQLPEYKAVEGYRNFDKDEIVKIKKSDTDEAYPGSYSVQNDGPVKIEAPPTELPQPKFNHVRKKPETECTFIKSCETNFHSAISLLKASPKIGVSGKDVSKGRFGRASVLAISTPSNIFVFDLLALGDDVLGKGLKEVLESSDTVKVVHDCRLLSDCLKHKHLISLENVRDVEAEDIMVVFQERSMIRRHPRSLEYLAKVYLGVEMEGSNETGEVWNERPLPENLFEALVFHASILLPLQEAIERKYLQKLIDASSIYNAHVRSLDFFDVLNGEHKKTLRKQMIKLVVPQNQTRSEFKSSRISWPTLTRSLEM